ncbi:hypothetical protein BGZ94_000961 [Podila epigama]|nr:hypothetical protein BGZ94_000961 [Podila epigama]
MNGDQIAYMRQIRDGSFSLKQWGILADTSDAKVLDQLWTGAAQEVLKQLGQKGTNIGNRVSKISRKERMETWQEAIQDRQFKRDLRPFAHRQMKSQVADMTNEFEAQSATIELIKSKLADDCAPDSAKSTADARPKHNNPETVHDTRRSSCEEDITNQHNGTNDANDEDLAPDNEFGTEEASANTEHAHATKKRKNSKQFTDSRRKSLQRRYSSLGEKWVLKSGVVVEDVLFEAGKQMTDFQ